jgi:hypothetical protein
MTSKITLQCVKEGSKLRIKFFSFTDDQGKVFTNVYNNNYNCKFPRDIRVAGRYYEIGPHDLELVSRAGTAPFYNVKKNTIKIIENIDLSSLHIYEVTECVICMCEPSQLIFVPCGHRCCCSECYKDMCKTANGKKCPLCRREINMAAESIEQGSAESIEQGADTEDVDSAATNLSALSVNS